MTEKNCAPFQSRSEFLKMVLILLPIFAIAKVLEQWISEQTVLAMGARSGGIEKLAFYATLSFLTSAFIPLVSMLVVFLAWRLSERTFWASLGEMVKEQLRAYGRILTWSLVFILPGLWKILEYIFVPLVVFADPAYDRGEVDALKESRRLFYKIWPWILGYALISAVIWPLTIVSFDSYRSYIEYPVIASSLTVIDLLVFVLFQWLLLKLWRKAHGTHVQVAGH